MSDVGPCRRRSSVSIAPHPHDRPDGAIKPGEKSELPDDGMELLRRVAPSHVAAVRRNLVDAVDNDDFEALGRVFTAVLKVEGEVPYS